MVLCVVFKDGRQNVRSVAADLVQALIIYRWYLKIISLVEWFYVCEIILEVSIEVWVDIYIVLNSVQEHDKFGNKMNDN